MCNWQWWRDSQVLSVLPSCASYVQQYVHLVDRSLRKSGARHMREPKASWAAPAGDGNHCNECEGANTTYAWILFDSKNYFIVFLASTAASTHGHYTRRLRHCSSSRSLSPTSRNVLFDARRRLSGTHFLRLSSEATYCLFSNLG